MEKKIIIDKEMEDYKFNEALLMQVSAKYGPDMATAIDDEMFADTGSIGKAELVTEPEGEYRASPDPDFFIKGAWLTDPIYQSEDGDDVFATCFKLDDNTYFKFYSRA
jgi:hypothetical protein